MKKVNVKRKSGRHMPDYVECTNCKRRLDPAVYQLDLPEDVDRSTVHDISTPLWPYFTIQCTCGQWMKCVPWEWDKNLK